MGWSQQRCSSLVSRCRAASWRCLLLQDLNQLLNYPGAVLFAILAAEGCQKICQGKGGRWRLGQHVDCPSDQLLGLR